MTLWVDDYIRAYNLNNIPTLPITYWQPQRTFVMQEIKAREQRKADDKLFNKLKQKQKKIKIEKQANKQKNMKIH